jgi:hypothetical protein
MPRIIHIGSEKEVIPAKKGLGSNSQKSLHQYALNSWGADLICHVAQVSWV